jgi:hypothetical protein
MKTTEVIGSNMSHAEMWQLIRGAYAPRDDSKEFEKAIERRRQELLNPQKKGGR